MTLATLTAVAPTPAQAATGGNAIGKRLHAFEIDNAHRSIHGALLDAQLLADVWLAMTRGQESLDMAIAVAAELGASFGGEAVIVPVPLARTRERERGYNQSGLLAHAIAAKWKIPVWDEVVIRGRATESQTRLTPEQRRRNVSSAFTVAPRLGARLRGAHGRVRRSRPGESGSGANARSRGSRGRA